MQPKPKASPRSVRKDTALQLKASRGSFKSESISGAQCVVGDSTSVVSQPYYYKKTDRFGVKASSFASAAAGLLIIMTAV